jgi:hypothetical protein
MAISYPLSGLPSSPRPRNATIVARSTVGLSESQFSFKVQKQRHSGQRWEFDLELPPMTQTEAAEWEAFLLKLNGTEGTVLVEDPDRKSAAGAATGTPTVSGAHSAGANSLATAGWTTSTANILVAGDRIQIGNYMYTILDSQNSDASGNATFDIWPRLRAAQSGGESITTSNCKTTMRLASNQMQWNTDSLTHVGMSITFVEEV